MMTISATEGALVKLPRGVRGNRIRKKLIRASNRNIFPLVVERNGKLFAEHIVGAVDLGDVVIEFLPKVASQAPLRAQRDFLIKLLRFTGSVKSHALDSGRVDVTNEPIMEIFIAQAARDLLDGLRQGLPRHYRTMKEDSSTIRGKIDFNSWAKRLPTDRHIVPIIHSPLQNTNLLTQTLSWMTTKLISLTRSSRNREMLSHARLELSTVEMADFKLDDIERIRLAKLDSHWESSVDTARLLARGTAPNPTASGDSKSFMIVFSLKHLFERAVAKIFVHHLAFSHAPPSLKLNLLKDVAKGKAAGRLLPDIHLKNADLGELVVDVKWKRLNPKKRLAGVEQKDLYQMFAYLETSEAHTGIFIYPKDNWMHGEEHAEVGSYITIASGKRMLIWGIPLEQLVLGERHERTKIYDKLRQELTAAFA